jgi:hypothetical protein
VTKRDWSVRRHRPRTRTLGVTRAVAIGLASVAVLAGAAAAADTLGVRTVASRNAVATSWDIPAQVTTTVPAPSATPPLKVPADAPTNLLIAAISVSTSLEPIGLDANGGLVAPAYTDAGWYAGGTEPGDIGPAIIAGHYDGTISATPSIFYHLDKLKVGDIIQVKRSGKWIKFAVTAVASYPQAAFPTDVVYGPTPNAQLRLITCGGQFSAATGSYADNTVVFAAETQ